jgi:hypothetical protein
MSEYQESEFNHMLTHHNRRSAAVASVHTDYTHPGQVFCGVVIFLILVSIAILFDRGKRGLLNTVPQHYRLVIHAFFEELSTFGFVSLLAFLATKEWNGVSIIYMIGNSVGAEYGYGIVPHDLSPPNDVTSICRSILASNLSHLHFLLFGVSAAFICTSLLLLYFHVKHFEQYKKVFEIPFCLP